MTEHEARLYRQTPIYSGWSATRLQALHRVAKRSGFFRDPRDMRVLRQATVVANIKAIN